MNKPAAILFDWDGTLVNTLPALFGAHNHVRLAHGLNAWTESEFVLAVQNSTRELYPRIYGDKAQAAMDMLYSHVSATHLEHIAVLPDAEDLIRFIHGKGISMAIVSNKRPELVSRELKHLGWADMFYGVVGAGQAARDKPSGDSILMGLNLHKPPLKPAHIWYVGDMETDLKASHEAGCPAILITHGEDKSYLIETYKPFMVARNCADFLSILKNNI